MVRQIQTPAGKYSRRATLYRLKSTATKNAAGHIDESVESNWEPFAQRWLCIESIAGREVLVGDQMTTEATHTISTRSDSESRSLTGRMKAKVGTRSFYFSGTALDIDTSMKEVVVPAVEVR